MGTKRKRTYKVTNWQEYNESLVKRGDITIWFSDEAVVHWEHPNQGTKVHHASTCAASVSSSSA